METTETTGTTRRTPRMRLVRGDARYSRYEFGSECIVACSHADLTELRRQMADQINPDVDDEPVFVTVTVSVQLLDESDALLSHPLSLGFYAESLVRVRPSLAGRGVLHKVSGAYANNPCPCTEDSREQIELVFRNGELVGAAITSYSICSPLDMKFFE